MTAKELIERLKTMPPETEILTHGYKGGFNSAIIDDEVCDFYLFDSDDVDSWYGPWYDAPTHCNVSRSPALVKGPVPGIVL